MQNWKVTPAEVFAASPLVPVMVINELEQALPMAKALLDGGISVFEITLRTSSILTVTTRANSASSYSSLSPNRRASWCW